MDRSQFSQVFQQAIVEALAAFRREYPAETPYAFAVILGQQGNYLGYAIATEQGLRRTVETYESCGYRYQGWEGEVFYNRERLSIWLRWANPDDGWRYGDFPAHFEIPALLASLVGHSAFGVNAEDLEEFCTNTLADLRVTSDWRGIDGSDQVVLGVTEGVDPRNFLRTATRANDYRTVTRLWWEYWQSDEIDSKIARQN